MKRTVNLEINVQEPYFSLIRSGQKTVEGRLAKEKFLKLKVGDTVLINNSVMVELISTNLYPSFRSMLESEGLFKVLPNVINLDEGEQVYYRFYSKLDENQLGVLALAFKLIVIN